MYEELKARLREHDDERLYLEADELLSQAAYAIEQLERQLEEARGNYLGAMTDCGNLERQLADRDAEIAKYRDAPVVAWVEVVDSYEGPYHFNGEKLLNVGKHKLIVKPGE